MTRLGFNAKKIVKIAAHRGGSRNLQAVIQNHAALIALGFNAAQIVKITNCDGGSRNLAVIIEKRSVLVTLGFSAEQITKIVAHHGGSKNLQAVIDGREVLIALGFSTEQIVKIVAHDGGSKNLNVIIKHAATIQRLYLTPDSIASYPFSARSGRKQLAKDINSKARDSIINGLTWLNEPALPLIDNRELSDPILPGLVPPSFNHGFFSLHASPPRPGKRGAHEITRSALDVDDRVEHHKQSRIR